MRTSESIAAIAPALVEALTFIRGAPKDGKNPHFKNAYASLESVIEASRSALSSRDLVSIQGLGEVVNGALCVTTRILHKSGEWIEDTLHVPLGKIDAQGVGSAASYGRRYGLMAMLNMPAIDDDAQASVSAPAPSLPSSYAAKRNGLGPRAVELMHEIPDLESPAACTTWINARAVEIGAMPLSWQNELQDAMDAQWKLVGGTALAEVTA